MKECSGSQGRHFSPVGCPLEIATCIDVYALLTPKALSRSPRPKMKVRMRPRAPYCPSCHVSTCFSGSSNGFSRDPACSRPYLLLYCHHPIYLYLSIIMELSYPLLALLSRPAKPRRQMLMSVLMPCRSRVVRNKRTVSVW